MDVVLLPAEAGRQIADDLGENENRADGDDEGDDAPDDRAREGHGVTQCRPAHSPAEHEPAQRAHERSDHGERDNVFAPDRARFGEFGIDFLERRAGLEEHGACAARQRLHPKAPPRGPPKIKAA